jgi:hypothetical protein
MTPLRRRMALSPQKEKAALAARLSGTFATHKVSRMHYYFG